MFKNNTNMCGPSCPMKLSTSTETWWHPDCFLALHNQHQPIPTKLTRPYNMSESREFTIFSRLPTELRLKIWNTSLDGIEGRIVELRCQTHENHMASLMSQPAGVITHTWGDKGPPEDLLCLLGTNQESRGEALRKYKIMFGITNPVSDRINGMWFNPAVDTLSLPVEPQRLCFPRPGKLPRMYSRLLIEALSVTDLDQIKYLALDVREWNWYHEGHKSEMERYEASKSTDSPLTPPTFPILPHFKKLERLVIVESHTRGLWSLDNFQRLQRYPHATMCGACSQLTTHERLQEENDFPLYMSEADAKLIMGSANNSLYHHLYSGNESLPEIGVYYLAKAVDKRAIDHVKRLAGEWIVSQNGYGEADLKVEYLHKGGSPRLALEARRR